METLMPGLISARRVPSTPDFSLLRCPVKSKTEKSRLSAVQLSSYGYYELFHLGLCEFKKEVEFVIYAEELGSNSEKFLFVLGWTTRLHLVQIRFF
jgi:hypothetical protein